LWMPLVSLPIVAWMTLYRPALRAAAAGALVLFVWNWLAVDTAQLPADYYTPTTILEDVLPPIMDQVVFWLTGATLIVLLLASLLRRFYSSLLGLALLGVLATTWSTLRYGTWREGKAATSTFEAIAERRKASALTNTDPGEGMEMASVTAYRRRALPLARPLGSIEHRVEREASAPAVYRRLKSALRPLPLLIDGDVVPLSPTQVARHDQVSLVYNTSNRLVFQALAGRDGYFVLGQPWLPGFVAWVDGARVPIVVANALYPAIHLARGAHQIEFRFVSWPFLSGVVLAFLTAVASLFWLLYPIRRRAVFAALVLVSGLVLGFLLHHVLYRGPSFGTDFQWQSQPGESKTRR